MSIASAPPVAVRPSTAAALSPVVSQTGRLPLLDLLRAVAAHLIVWHHLAFYGPLSDGAYPLLPGTIDWLYDWGRMAVQVFFVVGGFVAAGSFWRLTQFDAGTVGTVLVRRYRRIAGPYCATLLVAIAANSLADRWMDHPSLSAPPTWPQVLAHAALLHDVLGYEALTAGVWYLAIDFQLFLLTLLTMAAARQASPATAGPVFYGLIALLGVASLFWFNRDPRWEVWAVYFLGSYAVGVVLEGVSSRRLGQSAFWLCAAVLLLALVAEWRPRLAVCLATGGVIYGGIVGNWIGTWPHHRLVAWLGQTSYSLFLIHFPVCLVVNAVLSPFVLGSPAACLVGMMAAYTLSVLASIAFYHGVERAFR